MRASESERLSKEARRVFELTRDNPNFWPGLKAAILTHHRDNVLRYLRQHGLEAHAQRCESGTEADFDGLVNAVRAMVGKVVQS